MADTGVFIKDALDNMKVALDTQRAAWGVSEVFVYPAWQAGTKNAICLVPGSVRAEQVELAYPTLVVDYKVPIQIWCFLGSVMDRTLFNDAYTLASKIVWYLVEHPSPNSYGQLLLDDQAFGPTVGEFSVVQTEGAPLYGIRIDTVLTYTKTHTIT